MKPFTTHTGILAPHDHANVDTDQIIPKQFLKSIRRTGFGAALFFDARYLANGDPDLAFTLNAPAFRGASILVTRNNFGCGSSREHAVWAVMQYGFRAVIAPWQDRDGARAPGFADIFRGNAAKNGLLTLELPPEQVDILFAAIAAQPGVTATINLAEQTVALHAAAPRMFRFEMDPAVRTILLNGLDDITTTLRYAADIESFEDRHDPQMPARA